MMNIPPAVSTLLGTAAPTLLAALAIPPPFNIIASAVASGVLGHFLPSSQTPAGPAAPGQPPALSPDQLVDVIKQRSADPDILTHLREAEERLKDYEFEHNIRFAELAAKDRDSARTLARDTSIASPLLKWGMLAVVLPALVIDLFVILGAIMVIAGFWAPSANNAAIAAPWYTVIGTIIAAINGAATQVLAFYFGASQADSRKDASLTQVLTEQGRTIGEAAQRTAETAKIAAQAAQAVAAPRPDTPRPPATPPEAWMQGPYGGTRWRITPDGLLNEGETTPRRTVGEPVTVRRIWAEFGDIIASVCAAHAVPPEVVVAMIATESRGQPKAYLQEPDGRTSLGLMQILTGTASDVMKRPVSAAELQDPATNIDIGVSYMEHFRDKTQYDPILSAACHNAGGLYPPRPQDQNPYNLRTTGDHLVRMSLYYNDAVAAAKADGWFK